MVMNKIEILYEDEEIYVINKPFGMSVQGGVGIAHPLDEELAKQVGNKVHLVHRLDKETSGLMIVAKTPAAATKWISLISSKQVQKEYTAVCFGVPVVNGKEQNSGTIQDKVQKSGRELSAVTHFQVEETKDVVIPATETAPESVIKISRLHLKLGTGRMHQIRIHLASVKCPICADDKHGDFKMNKKAQKALKIKKLQLASTKLTIPLNHKNAVFQIDTPEHFYI